MRQEFWGTILFTREKKHFNQSKSKLRFILLSLLFADTYIYYIFLLSSLLNLIVQKEMQLSCSLPVSVVIFFYFPLNSMNRKHVGIFWRCTIIQSNNFPAELRAKGKWRGEAFRGCLGLKEINFTCTQQFYYVPCISLKFLFIYYLPFCPVTT